MQEKHDFFVYLVEIFLKLFGGIVFYLYFCSANKKQYQLTPKSRKGTKKMRTNNNNQENGMQNVINYAAEAVANVREWFGVAHEEQPATTAEAEPEEPETLRGATLQQIERESEREGVPAWLKPGQTFKRTMNDGREVVAICTRLLLDGFAFITENGCAVVDHVKGFDSFDFGNVEPCDIDDNAPRFARMLSNFARMRKDFEEYQSAHPYNATETAQAAEQAMTDEQPAEHEHGDTLAEIHEEKREFSDNTRVIVTSLQAVGTVHEYKNGKYLVIFDDGKGTGNSWHKPEELATVPEWIKDGAKVYNVKRWRTGEPFTISDAAATVPTLTTADGFKFMCNISDIVNNYTPHAPEAAHAPETVTTEGQPAEVESAAQNEPEELKTVEFYEREATDEHGRRIKKASEIKEQAARIECNYIAGRDGLRGIARRLERTKGAQHPDTVRAYERLQRRAAWLRRAELSAHAEAGRKRRAAYLRETTEEGNTLPAGEFGDLCYDYFGKSSVIVFGNTEDHAKQLEEIGGKKSDRIRYSPLQNGRKWTEKSGRTSGYYFTTEKAKAKAVEYVQRVNLAIFKKYEKAATNVSQMPADFKEGDRVRTEHGLGTVTAHTPLHNAANSVCVKLDKFTYNYGWKGLPHLLIDCHCSNITRTDEGRNADFSDEDCKKEIIEAAQMGVVRCCARNGKEIRIRAAYDNDSGNPEHWTYCVTWYQGKAVRNCENGVTLDQAAHHFSHFKDEFTKQAEGKCVYKIGERVTRNGTGAAGTIDDYGIHDGRLTYIVKYDETQHREDGSEYLNEEVFAEEIKS